MISVNVSDYTTNKIMTLLNFKYSFCLELKIMLDESFSAKCVYLSEIIDVTYFVFLHNWTANERVNEILIERISHQLQVFNCTSNEMIKSSNNAESHKLFITS